LAFDHQFQWTLAVTAIIFISLQLLLAWTILRGRRNPPAAAPTGHFWLEISWTVTTATLFLALSFAGSRTWAKVAKPATGKETIEVYGHQFAWNFRYPGADGRFGVTGTKFISDA